MRPPHVCVGMALLVSAAGPALSARGTDPWRRLLAVGGGDPLAARIDGDPARSTLVTEHPAVDRALRAPMAARAPLLDAATAALLSAEVHDTIRLLGPWSGAGPASVELSPDPSTDALFEDPVVQERLAHLPPEFIEPFRALVTRWAGASAAVRTIVGSPGFADGEAEDPEWVFVDPLGVQNRYRSGPAGKVLSLLERGENVDRGALLAVSAALHAAVGEQLPTLRRQAARLPRSDGPLLVLETAYGRVLLGSMGPDHWVDDHAFVLDPGGDDRWLNNAGGNVGAVGALALAIDLAGNDEYRNERPHVQGAGAFGAGLLVDVAGDDRYLGLAEAQGSGWVGVGILDDRGGNDSYALRSGGQGSGIAGVGLLLDGAGDDRWVGRARAQGFAAIGGFGALLDRAGADVRRLGDPGDEADGPWGGWGQGAALGHRGAPLGLEASVHGGVALLLDGGGDDHYQAVAWAQGAASQDALALLLDVGGNDRYTVESFGQAVARQSAAAWLRDEGGDDRYEAGGIAQAAASQHAFAWLDDVRGDDRYSLQPRAGRGTGDRGQAAAIGDGACALLTDGRGKDEYLASAVALGARVRSSVETAPSYAVVLDGGGADRYALAVRDPGHTPADGAWWSGGPGTAGIDGIGPVSPPAGTTPVSPWVAGAFRTTALPPASPSWAEPLDPAAALLRDRWEALLGGESPMDARTLAEAGARSADHGQRRLAGRILLALGYPAGFEVLLSTWAHADDEHRPGGGLGTLRNSLALWLGEDGGPSLEGWVAALARVRPGEVLTQRAPAALAAERATRRSLQGRGRDALVAGANAAELGAGDPRVLARVAAVALYWAELAGHPESRCCADALLARDAAELAVLWAPDRAEAFVALARAFLRQGDAAAADRALDQAEHLDPDDPAVLALRREGEARGRAGKGRGGPDLSEAPEEDWPLGEEP